MSDEFVLPPREEIEVIHDESVVHQERRTNIRAEDVCPEGPVAIVTRLIQPGQPDRNGDVFLEGATIDFHIDALRSQGPPWSFVTKPANQAFIEETICGQEEQAEEAAARDEAAYREGR